MCLSSGLFRTGGWRNWRKRQLRLPLRSSCNLRKQDSNHKRRFGGYGGKHVNLASPKPPLNNIYTYILLLLLLCIILRMVVEFGNIRDSFTKMFSLFSPFENEDTPHRPSKGPHNQEGVGANTPLVHVRQKGTPQIKQAVKALQKGGVLSDAMHHARNQMRIMHKDVWIIVNDSTCPKRSLFPFKPKGGAVSSLATK